MPNMKITEYGFPKFMPSVETEAGDFFLYDGEVYMALSGDEDSYFNFSTGKFLKDDDPENIFSRVTGSLSVIPLDASIALSLVRRDAE